MKIIRLLTILFSLMFLATTHEKKFPKNFEWCVATSAHQIEGNNHNSDWWHFEQLPNTIKNNDKSGLGCNHWELFKEDTKLLKEIGVSHYRLSVEWAKIQPTESTWDENSLNHYKEEINFLRKNNIKAIITLHHFTIPKWLSDKGGWSNPQSIFYFTKYTSKVLNYLGNLVDTWITINEPLIFLVMGNVLGTMPPGIQNFNTLALSLKNILLAHGEAYHIIHNFAASHSLKYRVGVAHNYTIFEANTSYNPLDIFISKVVDKAMNWTFIDAIETGRLKLYFPLQIDIDENLSRVKGTQDFIGLNYYTRQYIKFKTSMPYIEQINKKGEYGISDMNQEIYPQGFFDVINKIHEKYPNKKIYITENGIADSKDQYRSNYIKMHLEQLHKAMEMNIPIEGYCHWSLLDNFEWAEGFFPRFGLYEVDYKTQKRTKRNSAEVFSKIVKENKL